jgi:hypothetical protein
LCAALLGSTVAGVGSADTITDQVHLERVRAMKELQVRLNMEGATRKRLKLKSYAKASIEAQRKGLPAPASPFRAKEATDDDGRIVRRAPLEREATPAALQAIQAIPANVAASDRTLDNLPGSGQAESSIAIWGDYSIVAWNDGDGFGGGSQSPHVQGYGYSTNGGATFTDGVTFPAPGGIVWTSDPVMTVNEKTGEFYYCGLVNPTGGTNGIGVVRGTFAGSVLTWNTPVVAVSVSNFTNFTDKQWIASDSSNGNLYVSYTDFFAAGNRVMFTRSTDGGATWSTPIQMNSSGANGRVQGSRPAVGPGGEVYVVWKELNNAGVQDFIRVRKSVNAGSTFGTVFTAASYFDNFGSGAPGFNRERAVSFPSIAVDRSGGPNNGRVYVSYHASLNYYDDALSTAGNVNESENNNSSGLADPFTMGSLIRGQLGVGDQDWFSFTAAAGTSYIFFVDSIPNPLYSLRVFCSDGIQQLAFAGDLNAPAGGQGLMVWTAPTSATYFVRLFYVNGGAAGGYRMHTGVAAQGPEPGRDMRDVMVVNSDNGSTWSAETRVNSELARFDNWLPEVIVAKDGCPYVTWFDWRDDNLTCAGRSHIYIARSSNGGATWSSGNRVTDVISDWTGTFTNIAPNQGDYSHMAAGAGNVVWTWADARNGDADVYASGLKIGQTVSACQSDTVVVPNSAFSAHFEAQNLNEVFGNDYTWSLSDQRGWPLTNGNISLLAGASGAIEPSISIPDTADAGTNQICLTVTNSKGTITATCCFTVTVNTNVSVEGGAVAFGLRSIVPNPATGPARISFTLPSEGRVALLVYGLRGERVRTLASGTMGAGLHQITWDGLDEKGHTVRPGTYFVRLEGFGQSAVQRFVKMQ